MPKAIHRDHQDTVHYIPMHHRTPSLSDTDVAIFKNLERRFFHESQVIHPSYLADSVIPQVFLSINFDWLLHIDEEICPLFVLEFFKSVRITRNFDQTISIGFIIRNYEIVLTLYNFVKILRVHAKELVCSRLIGQLLLFQKELTLIPSTTLLWMIMSLSVTSSFKRDHLPNARLRKVRMLLTRLHRRVLTIQPCLLTDAYLLTPHVMVPLTEGRVKRLLVDGKRPHPPTPTPSASSLSQSPSQSQEQINPVDNYTLGPVEYCNQLSPISKASKEYKQTKGMFKCLGHFLSNFGKKKKQDPGTLCSKGRYLSANGTRQAGSTIASCLLSHLFQLLKSQPQSLNCSPLKMASSASSSTKNPPRKIARTNIIDISSNESSPIQKPSNNHITTPRTTSLTKNLALSLTPPLINQILAPQPNEPSPLAPRELIFTTPPTSHRPYLNNLEDLPPRCTNPPLLPTFEQITSQPLPINNHIEYEPFFPPTNLKRSKLSAHLKPFMTRENIIKEIVQLQDLSNDIETALHNAQNGLATHTTTSQVLPPPSSLPPITFSTLQTSSIPPF
ncbi:hypothetical protein Tco_0774169 [Tanacetum coccineum]|uniref:Uncharacterized protein n=1 Tax=Tanacetum coccineum TaxID=301880 RepID=A0ABQ4ZRS7_9ASTR